MKDTHISTDPVGAQDNCAITDVFVGMGAIVHQPNFAPIQRRTLMAAVNTVAKELGLRATSVVVIDALLSCLPCKDPKTGAERPITPLTLLTVFAGNASLCFRAKGMTARQLRRHIDRLEQVGLVQRRDSANGKRFPIKRGNKIIGAFGIDLSPLLAKANDLVTQAQAYRQHAEELRGLKSCISRVRQECLKHTLPDHVIAFVQSTQNTLRRVGITLVEAQQILKKLQAILQNSEADETHQAIAPDEKTASDRQNVRHIEPKETDTKKTELRTDWDRLSTLKAFYPNAPKTARDLRLRIFELGLMLRIGKATLANALARWGEDAVLLLQDQIAERVHHILNPDRYFAAQIGGRVSHGQHP